jgi:histidinol-phosphatase (PHP family)
MSWTSYHIHSSFCHGLGEPEYYVEDCISRNVKSMGFSSHAPLTPDRFWTIKNSNLKNYIKHISKLKEKYRNQLQVFVGLEADYIPGELRFNNFRKLGVDYIIGSNHLIGKGKDGQYKRVEDIEVGDITDENRNAVVENYFKAICKMVELEKPDIIGHFDTIKKINLHDNYFREDEIWYRAAVMQALKYISPTNTIIEVNTSYIAESIDFLFPSPWILEESFKLGIPVTLSSDAHSPENVIFGFSKAAEILLNIGYKEIYALNQDGWKPYILTLSGIEY